MCYICRHLYVCVCTHVLCHISNRLLFFLVIWDGRGAHKKCSMGLHDHLNLPLLPFISNARWNTKPKHFKLTKIVRKVRKVYIKNYNKLFKASSSPYYFSFALFPVRGLHRECHSLIPHTVTCFWSLRCCPVDPGLSQRVWCAAGELQSRPTINRWWFCWHPPCDIQCCD